METKDIEYNCLYEGTLSKEEVNQLQKARFPWYVRPDKIIAIWPSGTPRPNKLIDKYQKEWLCERKKELTAFGFGSQSTKK